MVPVDREHVTIGGANHLEARERAQIQAAPSGARDLPVAQGEDLGSADPGGAAVGNDGVHRRGGDAPAVHADASVVLSLIHI